MPFPGEAWWSGRPGHPTGRSTRVETPATGTLKWTVKVRISAAPGNSPHPGRWKKAQPKTFRKGPRQARQLGADHGPWNLGPRLRSTRECRQPEGKRSQPPRTKVAPPSASLPVIYIPSDVSHRRTTSWRGKLDRTWRSSRTRFRLLRSCTTLTVLECLRNVLKLQQLACQLGEVRLCLQGSCPEELASLID